MSQWRLSIERYFFSSRGHPLQTASLQQEQPKPRKLVVATMILSSALAFLSTDIYLPYMRFLGEVLHTGAAYMQATVTIFMLSLALSCLVMAPLSDHCGRRVALLGGISLSLLGTVLLLFPSIVTFTLGRILQGVGAATGLSLSRTVIRDIAKDKRHLAKLYAIYSGILCIAPAASPVLGAHIEHVFGWRAVFIFLACLYAVYIVFVLRCFPETAATQIEGGRVVSNMIQGLRQALTSLSFMMNALMSAVIFGLYISYVTSLPYILQLELHRSVLLTSWAMASLIIGGLSSRMTNYILVQRLSIEHVLYLGLVIATCAGLSYALLQWIHVVSIYSILLPGILFTFATGFLYGAFVTNAMSFFKQGIGGLSAIYSAVQISGVVVLTAVVSVYRGSDMLLMAWMFAIGLGCTWLLNLWRRS